MRKYKALVNEAINELRDDTQAAYQQHRHLLEWAKGLGYVEPKSDYPLTQPDPAPERPAPYPWHPDVLSGKVSIAGGLVLDGEHVDIVDVHEPGRTLVLRLHGSPEDASRHVARLSELRPAPHDWQPGDTALVVSTAATDADADRDYHLRYPAKLDQIGRRIEVAPPADGNGGRVSLGGWHWQPADLLYIPPAEQPDARAELEAVRSVQG